MTTQRRAAMWANGRAFAAALLALGLAGACGKTDTTLSGETHFVMCDSDNDCAGLSDVPTCGGGYCRGEDGEKLDVRDDNSAGRGNSAGSSSDGNPPGGELACAGGCGDAECAVPGSCKLAAACTSVMCDDYRVDANACIRPACEHDTDCGEDERCVSTQWTRRVNCVPDGSELCHCDLGKGLVPMHVCGPVSKAGARGEWQYLSVNEIVIGQSTTRTYRPDGTVLIDMPVEGDHVYMTKQLSVADLEMLELSINGPILRNALSEDPHCDVTKATDVIMTLSLSPTVNGEVMYPVALEQNVAGCVLGGRPSSFFKEIYDLSSRY